MVTFHITNNATIAHNFRIRVGTTGKVLAKSMNLGADRTADGHRQAERTLLHDLLRHPPDVDAHVVPGHLTPWSIGAAGASAAIPEETAGPVSR